MSSTEIDFDCPHCRQPLSADASDAGTSAACSHCKKPVVVPGYMPPRQINQRIPCPTCAEMIMPAASKCPHCGTRLIDGRTFFQHVTYEANKPDAIARQKRTMRISYICVAVFLVLFFWFMRVVERHNSSPESKRAREQAAEAYERMMDDRYQRSVDEVRKRLPK